MPEAYQTSDPRKMVAVLRRLPEGVFVTVRKCKGRLVLMSPIPLVDLIPPKGKKR